MSYGDHLAGKRLTEIRDLLKQIHEVLVPRTSAIMGIVTQDAIPVVGAAVVADGPTKHRTETDANGQYTELWQWPGSNSSRQRGTFPMPRRTIVSAIALIALSCIEPKALPTETEASPVDSAYAAWPLTLDPDRFVVGPGALIDVSGVDEGRTPYTSLTTNLMPILSLCAAAGKSEVLPDCSDLEESGHIMLDLEQTELLLADWNCDPPKRNLLPGTIRLTSCFGLTVYQHIYDAEKVVIWPEDADTRYRITGCGETWVGLRLKRRHGHHGQVVRYPVDAVFSDTLHIRVDC
ncbi:MAG: hypothetical protein OXF01_18010 [Gemmatimonadetes bacterium]|nr:hypothetical protein [Gemmatimonadota bacterium]